MTPFRDKNIVTSPFGPRQNPFGGGTQMHRGVDSVTEPGGDWMVREATGGTVIRVQYDASRGNYIDVRTSPTHFERYQHMESIYLGKGNDAPQGRHLGLAGNTGDSTGRHLHFGVYRCGPETDGYTSIQQINSLEQYAVEPSEWSGIPNRIGTYRGNNDYDGEPAPEPVPEPAPEAPQMYTLTIGPMTQGDKDNIEGRAKELGLPVTATADSAKLRNDTLTAASLAMDEASAALDKASELLKAMGG